MDRAGVARALGAQHLRRLAGEGGEQDLAVDMFCEMTGKRRLAGAGIAEKPEKRRPPFLQPACDGFEGLVLLRCEFHDLELAGFGAVAQGPVLISPCPCPRFADTVLP